MPKFRHVHLGIRMLDEVAMTALRHMPKWQLIKDTGSMATISIASAKGGVGKTTVAILLGMDLALDGYKVTLLDCDVNQHATAFGTKAGVPAFRVIPSVDENNVLGVLRKAEGDSDIVIIDLPGGSSTLALKALQCSNFVLIPSQASLPDVRDAVKTIAQVDDAQHLAKAEISRSIIWTRVLSSFESRASRNVRKSVEGRGIPVFNCSMVERAVFQEMHQTGKVPRQVDTTASASSNVKAISRELLSVLEKMAVAA